MNADPEGTADHLPSAVRRSQTARDELGRFSESPNETASDAIRWETLMNNLGAGLTARTVPA
ncbi:MAG: hypothetical protein HYT87_10200 [Nitrospirae bacterium]|nr:hypothetical protein [Nitrospirota bacterium]